MGYGEKTFFFQVRTGEYKYKLNINVPDNEFGGYMTRMEIADTLPAGAELTAANSGGL